MTKTETVTRAGRREWVGLAVLTLPTMLAMLDLNVVILALPRLSTALHASGTEVLWITDVYGFLIAGFLVTMGRLGDRIGHRKLLLTGAAAFGVLSAIAAYSTGPTMLIIVRGLLGIAGATIMPSILASVKNMFPDPKQLGTAMGVWSTAMLAGIALGPAVGGFLLNSFWWGSVFLIAVPVMVVLLATGPFLLPESKDKAAGKLDFLSVALSLATMLPIVYGLTELARSGWAVLPLAAIAVGLACGAMFVRRQRKLADPVLDLDLFKVPAIGGGLIVYLIAGIVLAGSGLLMAQHLQLVEGYTPLRAALWLLVPSVLVIIGIQISMQLAKRMRPAWILMGGVLIAAVGMVVLTQVKPVNGLPVLIIGLCIVFLGVSPVPVLSNQMVMQSGPKEKAGSLGALLTTGGELGTALGIAIIGSLATLFYQGKVPISDQVPAAAGVAANDSITSAVTAAQELPPDIGQQLLTAARETFSSAYNNVAIFCAVVLVALAGLVYLTLRSIPPIGAPPKADGPAPKAPAQTGNGRRGQPVKATVPLTPDGVSGVTRTRT